MGLKPVDAQDIQWNRFNFIIGYWNGSGTGFGNSKSEIVASYNFVLDGKYIEVNHHSEFTPTPKKPEGEIHDDWGIISFDKHNGKYIYRQFNNEGYYNQYVLNDSLSNDNLLIFETELMENFVIGSKAKFTIKRINEMEMETIFELYFPGKEYATYGKNKLIRQVDTEE
ncbi:MAG: hypothetical protein A2W99_01575 [Bacteroidetes bacterium GWF2_33_16]|nr:MAG: hypothetical protein A2X00_16580 [Bacteroidetes bacterium GWE2_32_14]OFY06961.1 MAG: hypothetical protein A2W99_01575 [Bacteroidetes bacterium GWF2_33_16]